MALQGIAWGIAVMIALFFKGGDSQPVCARPPINSRIIGGQEASPGSWPWHVIFKNNGFYFCQGSLITDEWVLTAAQCAIFPRAVMHFGATNQSELGKVTRTGQFFCHQDYKYLRGNDICLVKLSSPVNFTDNIRPVCLAAENSTFYDGTSSWVPSFDYGESYSLQEIDVSVLGNTKCNCLYNNSISYPLTEDVICAESSKTAVYGDQGAALVTKKDSISVQNGILSYVDFWSEKLTVYTRVSRYQKWITDRVTGMEPGFVTYTSPGNDSDLNDSCPPPTTAGPYPTHDPYYTTQHPDTTTHYPYPTTDDSIFGGGETLIPVARVFSLSALVLFLHLFVGGAGN